MHLMNVARSPLASRERKERKNMRRGSFATEFKSDVTRAIPEKKHRLLMGAQAISRLGIVGDVVKSEHLGVSFSRID
jgi:hypothetical protein